MMKEFRFEPASQMITVEEGQNLSIDITGIKTAYRLGMQTHFGFPRKRWQLFVYGANVILSCYGAVQSLSGDAERDVAVEAVGQGDCSLYSEDTLTDEDGQFRLRGLLVKTLEGLQIFPKYLSFLSLCFLFLLFFAAWLQISDSAAS